MTLEGFWYKKNSSSQHKALLSIDENNYTLEVENFSSFNGVCSRLKIRERLGNTPRSIQLEDESVFTTLENDKVDSLGVENKKNAYIHLLESNTSMMLFSLFLFIFIMFAFFKWGIPWGSEKIAYSLPQNITKSISQNSLEVLDKFLFVDSKISLEKQKKIRQHFAILIKKLKLRNSQEFTLHFRLWHDGNQSIANAFALPSGEIILTDKFVKLCVTTEEMDSVILHEIGHIIYKHSLQRIIQKSFIAAGTMFVFGDTSFVGDVGVGLGSMLLDSSYAREYEIEADIYSFKKMLLLKIDPIVFSNILTKLTQSRSMKKSDKNVFDYLSSHPRTTQRVIVAAKFSECFKQKIQECKVD